MASSPQIQYISQRASAMGLDPRAVLAIAHHEGLSGGVGDNGTSFGPWQLHAGGALPKEVWAKGPEYSQRWAWSPQGIDYALGHMSTVARGLKGLAAVTAISKQFERPANPSAEISDAWSHYGAQPSGSVPSPSNSTAPSPMPGGPAPSIKGQHVVTGKVDVLGKSLAVELMSQAQALTGGGTPDLKNLFTLAKGFQSARRSLPSTRPAPLGGTALARGAATDIQNYQPNAA